MNRDELKNQILSRMDEIVEYVNDGKTIEIRIGKDGNVQLYDVKKKIVKQNTN